MVSHKRILKNFAKNYKLDTDELLIATWYYSEKKFAYLRNENSVIKNKDISVIKEIILKLKNKDQKKRIIKQIEPTKLIMKNYDFSTIGKVIYPIKHINRQDISIIYNELVIDFNELEDPIEPSGVKDEKLLEAAIFHPQTSYENISKYPTVETVAAALMYSLSHNHAFHNGNKRTAMVAMLVFLDRHHVYITCNEDDLFRISLKLADHKLVEPEYLYSDAEIYELARWIHTHSKPERKGERSITLKKLKQILSHFNCIILDNGRVQRIIKPKSFFDSKKVLISKRTIGSTISEGQEVDKNLIKTIRDDLELNSINGIDSEFFYEKASFTSSDFINKYKNLLRRLSRV